MQFHRRTAPEGISAIPNHSGTNLIQPYAKGRPIGTRVRDTATNIVIDAGDLAPGED